MGLPSPCSRQLSVFVSGSGAVAGILLLLMRSVDVRWIMA
jgi:hypothetical protein